MIILDKFTTDWPNCPKCKAISKISARVQYYEPFVVPSGTECLELRCGGCGYIIAQMPPADA